MRRPPAKRRGWTAPRIGGYQTRHGKSTNEPPGYSCHLGGQFDKTDYDDQRWDGYFGFAPKPDWPVEARRRRH